MTDVKNNFWNVERNNKDASKPVARHFNFPNHSKLHLALCGLSLHMGSLESRKTLEQKFIFQSDPQGMNECLFRKLISSWFSRYQ